jgi:hypothetical protein
MPTTSSPLRKPYYHEDIDFAALGLQDEEFAALLRQNDGRIDWQDPLAIQCVYTSSITTNRPLTRTYQTTNPLPPRPRLQPQTHPPLRPPMPTGPRPLELRPLAPRPPRHHTPIPHRSLHPNPPSNRPRHRHRRLMHLLAARLCQRARLAHARL